MDQSVPFPAPDGFHWVTKQEVRHWRSGKMIRRKDGRPFTILCRTKRKH